MENTIYIWHQSPASGQVLLQAGPVRVDSFFSKISNFLNKVAKITGLAGILFLLVSFSPLIWHTVKTQGTEVVSSVLVKPVSVESAKVKIYQPKLDPSLPLESKLSIPSIGVDTLIEEATFDNYEEALKEGIWRVSDFGTPYARSKPTILAAHRYGYLKWANLFRRKSSFYNLPKLKEGDVIEIIWRQRKYVYEVYATGEGEEITDYSADLILYTCESLNSPVKIFKYARLLEI